MLPAFADMRYSFRTAWNNYYKEQCIRSDFDFEFLDSIAETLKNRGVISNDEYQQIKLKSSPSRKAEVCEPKFFDAVV